MEKTTDSQNKWYAERTMPELTWDLYLRQEDFSFGLAQNGLTLEDIIKGIWDKAVWDNGEGQLFTIVHTGY